jgi:hypothetical protein
MTTQTTPARTRPLGEPVAVCIGFVTIHRNRTSPSSLSLRGHWTAAYARSTLRRILLVALLAVTGIVFLSLLALSAFGSGQAGQSLQHRSASSSGRVASTSCPQALVTRRFAIRRLARVIRREVPRAFGEMTNQAGPGAWRGYWPVAALSLNPAHADFTPVRAYRRAAVAKCGLKVAARSWVVLIQFPDAASAQQGDGVAFLARTPAGWRIWGTTVVSSLPRIDFS